MAMACAVWEGKEEEWEEDWEANRTRLRFWGLN